MNIARLIYATSADPEDLTHTYLAVALLATLESFVSILVGSLPTFGPLIWREKFRGSSRKWPFITENQIPVRTNNGNAAMAAHLGGQHRFKTSYDDGVPLRNMGASSAGNTVESLSDESQTEHLRVADDGRIGVRTDITVYDCADRTRSSLA